MRGILPINASNLYTDICTQHSIPERPNLLVVPERKRRRSDVGAAHPLLRPEPVVEAHRAKGHQNHDLERDTRNDGLVTGVDQLAVLPAPAGRQSAADGLNEKTAHVGGHEDEGEPLWPDPREGWVQRDGEVLERQIYRDAG